ncbi:TPA: TraR/DksA family transcriptional regulator [Citrobacter koseri]|nr:TraR/DksA family transcriptional regulator [Citrobacter koseri]
MTSEIIDQSSELEEMMREQAIAAHRIDRNAISAERCEECDEPIPEPRRAAVPGCQTCVNCAIDNELKNKQRGRQ